MSDRLVTEQPAPQANEKLAVWDLVLADMRARDAEGRRKYGVPLQPNNGRDAMIDLYQELLDAVVYARQAIYERDSAQPNAATMTAIEAGELATRAASAACAQGAREGSAKPRQLLKRALREIHPSRPCSQHDCPCSEIRDYLLAPLEEPPAESPTDRAIIAAQRKGHDTGLQQGYALRSASAKAEVVEAFQRGAEAMREAAFLAVDQHLSCLAAIRALPIPKDSL